MPNPNANEQATELDPQQEAAIIARCLQMNTGEQTTIRALAALLASEGNTGLTLTRLVQILRANPNFEVLEGGQITRL
jgi:hypothetical protein